VLSPIPRVRIFASGLTAATLLAMLSGVAAAQGVARGEQVAPKTGEVFVVQGLPGSVVGVELDGKSLGKDIEAKDIIGPLDLAVGEHTIDFVGEEWAVSSTFAVADPSTDIVLHWPADVTDQPEVTVFTNNVAPIVSEKARLTVAHTAVVPPADVRVNEQVLFANIANGEFVSSEVAADTYSVEIVPTGQDGPALLGPVDLPVKAGTLTRVFAIGEPRDGSMDAIVQTLPLSTTGSPAPDSVDAGSAGLIPQPASEPVTVTDPPRPTLWALCLLAGGALLVSATRRRLHR